ncbi:hypothetical protein [Actinomadura sp. B10D3]|uniref:hypothetical protein n=1 Tax=Actinomadura sp. B10D3 TaxID=3153557 RepID=UPI00325F1D09
MPVHPADDRQVRGFPGGGRLDPRQGRLHRRRGRRAQAPLVAVADIAAAAAGLLLDRSWSGAGSVPVLGPRDLSPNDLARIMTEQLGRPVRYERRPLGELRAALVGHGLDEAFVQGIVDMKHAKNEGLDAGVTRTPDTTGATTFEHWCTQVLKPAVLF